MPLFPSDFKQFKHVKSDDKTTTLQHPKGHQIIIAHKALSKNMKAQLDALSKTSKDDQTVDQAEEKQAEQPRMYDQGGGVEDKMHQAGDEVKKDVNAGKVEQVYTPQYTPASPSSAQQPPAQSQTKEEARKAAGYAKGGKVKMYAEPEALVSQDDPAPEVAASIPDYAQGVPQDATPDVKDPSAAEQAGEFANKAMHHSNMYKAYQLGKAGINLAKEEVPKAVEDFEKGAGISDEAPQQPQTQTPSPLDPNNAPQMGQQPTQSDPNQQPTPESVDSNQAQIPSPKATQPVTYQDHKQNDMNEMIKEGHTDFGHDLANGHIDPQTYDKLMGGPNTLSKIGSIFGLMLSGMGSGLAHQPNMFLEMMNNEIKNNLYAQNKNIENKQSLMSINGQRLLNEAQAKNLNTEGKIKQFTLSNMQANQLALAKQVNDLKSMPVGSPQRQQAEQILGMMNNAVQNENYKLADRASAMTAYYKMMYGNNGQPESNDAATVQRLNFLRMNDPEKAKDLASRFIPGVGTAEIPVPDKIRDDLVSHKQLLDTAKDVLDYSKSHTNLVPGTSGYNIGVQKTQILQQKIRDGLLGTVFRESEKPLLEKFVDDNPAGAMKTFSTQPKIRTIIERTLSDMNTTRKSYGLPAADFNSEPQYKISNGIKYMRGPDGKAIPVK